MTRREFMITAAANAAALTLLTASKSNYADASSASTSFQPNWDSLSQYECPEWFRDAKFGIWAHWNAMCVPAQGNWYARTMYQEDSSDYEFHVANYGHPSKVGFKEIDRMWKAENWDPAHLIGLYKAAGAKYFVALANHHDNLDCWASVHQPWNTIAIGPQKNIVAIWEAETRKAGLRFGVSCHASRTWSWMEPCQLADTKGPLAGVPYDGNLTKADGVGTWWNGLDPQDLYAQNHKRMGDDYDHWHNWLNGDLPSKAYCERFYNRVIDLLDQHHPDLLYFDDAVLPLYEVSDIGLRIAAYQYNTSMSWHKGKLEAVLNGKDLTDQQQKCLIQDYERGASDVVRPYPWQTDTCIGNWFYNTDFHERNLYKTAEQVIQTLVDIVSKNGNLLLSIPLRADGTPDEIELKFLSDMAGWMDVNSEAIFSTRPWTLYGEGTIKSGGNGRFTETAYPYTSNDIRFTTKDNALYATALGWPDNGTVTVTTLAAGAPNIVGTVISVSLLGSAEKLTWQQTTKGLVVTFPTERPCSYAYVMKIEGIDVAASTPQQQAPPPIAAGADGVFSLTASSATLTGSLRFQPGPTYANIGYWNNAGDTVSWKISVPAAATYNASLLLAAAGGDSSIVMNVDGVDLSPIPVPSTADWTVYETIAAGSLSFAAAGSHTITVGTDVAAKWKALNLVSLTLTPAAG